MVIVVLSAAALYAWRQRRQRQALKTASVIARASAVVNVGEEAPVSRATAPTMTAPTVLVVSPTSPTSPATGLARASRKT